MKNQGRRNSQSNSNYNSDHRDDRGRFVSDSDYSDKNRNSRLYQDRNDDYRRSESRGRYDDYNHRDTSADYGTSRGTNSGYDDADNFSGRRGQNYEYGSQQDNDQYRNFSTQGRNSGLGNQGGYSSYDHSDDQYSERRNAGYYGSENNQGRNFRRDQMNNGSWGTNEDARQWGETSGRNMSNGWENEGNLGSRDDNDYNSRKSYSNPSPYASSSFGNRAGRGSRMSGTAGISGMNSTAWSNEDDNQSSSLGSYSRRSSYGQGSTEDTDNEIQRLKSHRGKGPKGYKRSDERIEEDVNDILMHDHHIDATNIEVAVKNGEVTLSGSVSDKQAKRHAEDLSETVSGVSSVENKIRVSKESDDSTDKSKDSKTSTESTADKSKIKSQNGVHA
jgi:osmotically-inducible protein OsmY